MISLGVLAVSFFQTGVTTLSQHVKLTEAQTPSGRAETNHGNIQRGAAFFGTTYFQWDVAQNVAEEPSERHEVSDTETGQQPTYK